MIDNWLYRYKKMTNAFSKLLPKVHHIPIMGAEMCAILQGAGVTSMYGKRRIRLRKPDGDNGDFYKVEGNGVIIHEDIFVR